MASAEETRALKDLLTKARVKEDLSEWMIKAKGIECVSDLYGYFTAKGYEEVIHTPLQTDLRNRAELKRAELR